MASTAADAPSTAFEPLQIGAARRITRGRAAIESWFEAERDQLVLWLPVALGSGVSAWFLLPDPRHWIAALLLLSGVALGGVAAGRGGRAERAVTVAALAAALGLALIWWRAERVAAPVLPGPTIARFEARIQAIEPLPARGLLRLRLRPIGAMPALPPQIRVNVAEHDAPAGLTTGAVIDLRARLMPPTEAALPGAYDYARVAWFDRIGATGRGFAPITIVSPAPVTGGDYRARLSRHVQQRVGGSAGAIAATLATGDRGAISDSDADAMRRAGLAHLLAISGLHVTAVVVLVMLLVQRLLALSPWLALRFKLPLVAAGAGAMAAVGYTLLTGAAVPTIRSCVAALLVLLALMLGRQALTLRLVAAGALIVLLLWPQSLVGPSFQLSFAAVTTIIALHDHPRIRAAFSPRPERIARRVGRGVASLLLTGMVVEATLAPIALYHFHKSGLYGALANIVAIPLTTFVVMPAEALALAFDAVGLGAPLWWIVGHALRLLLWIAHATADAPGALAMLPAMPDGAFGLMIGGGLWVGLWRTRWRWLGLAPIAIGALWAVAAPSPDLLVTGDGRHIGLRAADGGIAMLRDRAGGYTQAMLAENSGVDGLPERLSDQPDARCSRDLCIADRIAGGRRWRILATRGIYLVPLADLIAACRQADIVVSERRLPKGCRPRWLKLDRATLAHTGGVAITLATGRIATVRTAGAAQPWLNPPTTPRMSFNRSGAAARRDAPERAPDRG